MKPNEDSFEIIDSYYDFYRELIKAFRRAKHTIYYTSWLLDFSTEVGPNLTFQDLVNECTSRGVKLKFLIFYNPLSPWKKPKAHPLVNIKYVYSFGEDVSLLIKTAVKINYRKNHLHSPLFYNGMHQKYFAVDSNLIYLGQVDINPQRTGDLFKWQYNEEGFIWHEFGLKAPCTEEFWSFCEKNFDEMAHYNLTDSKQLFGSFSGENDELVLIEKLVTSAKKSVYIENQQFFCTHKCSHNLAQSIVSRLKQAFKQSEDFYIHILSNNDQPDLDSGNQDLLIKTIKFQTKIYFEMLFKKADIPMHWANKHFKITRLEKGDKPLFVHSKFIIVDEQILYFSSANLTERSLGNSRDRELGVLVENKARVRTFLKRILSFYAQKNLSTDLVKGALLEADKPTSIMVSEKPFNTKCLGLKWLATRAFTGCAQLLNRGRFY